MRKGITSTVVLVGVLLGIGVWLSAQRDVSAVREDRSRAPSTATQLTPRTTEYRGANVVLETITQGDLEALAGEWNANLIRVHLGVEYKCGGRAPLELSQS